MGPRSRLASCIVAVFAAIAASSPADAQSWSGTWTSRTVASTPTGNPGPRAWVDLIVDPNANRPVLFGGSGSYYYNDILNIDFAASRWVEVEPYQPIVQPLGPPCPRDEHAVVFDDQNGLYWSFGGSGYACGRVDGRVAAGSTTTTIIDPSLPATTVNYYRDYFLTMDAYYNTYYAFVSAYDPVAKKLTLLTPIPAVPAGQAYKMTPQAGGGTWSYDPALRRWRGFDAPSLGYAGAKPASRLSPAFAYSTRDDAAVMFGGMAYNDTWALDAITESWVQMRSDGAAGSPPRRSQITNSMAYDAARDAFVLFGGKCSEPSGCNGAAFEAPLNDTWVYRISTNTWTRMFPTNPPGARAQHTLSYDPVNGVVLLFGGKGSAGYFNDTWVYNLAANTWTRVTTNSPPLGRRLHAAVYDPSLGQHVIYGGVNANESSTGEVWTFRLATSGGNVPPSASFTINPASGPPSTSFAFNASLSVDPDGTIVSYAWNFGDGTTGTGPTVTHTFPSSATYAVTLTVTDNLGATGTTTSNVVVTPANVAPTARISVTQTAADTFSFSGSTSTDPDGTIVSYAWNFGDGATATGASTSHRYTAPGNYTVGLLVTDNAGATNSATASVTASTPLAIVLQKKVSGVVAGGAVTAVTANGTPVAFTNIGGGAFEFTLSATTATTFSVVVTAAASGGTTVTSTFNVAVP
jgi:PKD repeat protein